MSRNTYLYENRMFTNKVKQSIFREERKKTSREKVKGVGVNYNFYIWES